MAHTGIFTRVFLADAASIDMAKYNLRRDAMEEVVRGLDDDRAYVVQALPVESRPSEEVAGFVELRATVLVLVARLEDVQVGEYVIENEAIARAANGHVPGQELVLYTWDGRQKERVVLVGKWWGYGPGDRRMLWKRVA